MRFFFFGALLLLSWATGFAPTVSKPGRDVRQKAEALEDTRPTFVKCATCDAVYPMTVAEMGTPGRRVRCAVCGNVWYQSTHRMNRLFDNWEFQQYPDEKKKMFVNGGPSRPMPRHQENQGVALFVANLSFDVDEYDLAAFFEPVVPGASVSVVRYDDGRSKGYGFVTCRTDDDAQRAIQQLDGADLAGRDIAVRMGNKSPGGSR